jgi:DNA-binding HxlR family transcriptional regulator
MAKKGSKKVIHSSAETTLTLIGNKWTILIIEELFLGTRRFGELEKSLLGISPRTLSLRLSSLEKASIIKREVFPEVPPRVEYRLTPLGRTLEEMVILMKRWGSDFERKN